jgi:hypothetical protein
MGQSLQGVIGQEKGVGASRLTPLACSFYAGVNAMVGLEPPREAWCTLAVSVLKTVRQQGCHARPAGALRSK